MISIKDYAAMNNVTYEAVRQQVKRYSADLEEHIKRDGRQQFLDDYAVAFLDERRQKNPVVILQADKNAELEDLRREQENLLRKIAEQADKISVLSEWKSDNALLIAEANGKKALLEATEKKCDDLQEQLERKNEAEKSLIARAEKAESSFSDAKQYAAELEAYLKLSKFMQLFTKKPTLKNLKEAKE